jgi:hypothetical protein
MSPAASAPRLSVELDNESGLAAISILFPIILTCPYRLFHPALEHSMAGQRPGCPVLRNSARLRPPPDQGTASIG